jgi:GTPase SAR1 family protein
LLADFLKYFRSVTKSYYRGAAGALLVYDISSRESYNAVSNWLTDAQNLANPNLVVLLVGNKRDLEEDRQVSFLEASQFAQENGKSLFVSVIVCKHLSNSRFLFI